MWLQRFHSLYPVATERHIGRRQDLSNVEARVSRVGDGWKVDRRVLEVIEDPDSGWDYPKWWPRMSSQIQQPIALPTHIYSAQGKRTAVEALQNVIKNIEVVSVVLRFMCPDGFGIFSPPVVSFLCFSPSSNPVESYVSYLSVLKGFVEQYKVLTRLADIDMALWSAAHLVHDPGYASLREEMYGDEYLQEVRIRNLVKGLRGFWRRTGMQRLILARALLDQDYTLASVIAARVYESVLREMMEYHGLVKGVIQKVRPPLVQQLERRSEIASLGLQEGQLERLWELRHKAVHGELDFTREKARTFEHEVEEVWRIWQKRCSKRR
jgi:hypothetical protein